MTRHFLQLYVLIVATLAAVSWGQERLWRAYAAAAGVALEDPAQAALFAVVEDHLLQTPRAERDAAVAGLKARTGVDLELFALDDVAGDEALARLARGEAAFMSAAGGERWLLRRFDDQVLAFRHAPIENRRTAFEWALALSFYAAIALVLMIWLWPLTRDLRKLERATLRFGDRNWTFDADVGPRSQVYPLAQAFRRMASRIDALIQSHRDLSNAMSHEIKTPLARMRFEVEAARGAASAGQLGARLDNIDSDISELDAFVTAMLDYAILERAEVALNIGEHDFAAILPAVIAAVRRGVRPELEFECDVDRGASGVVCDAHLMETVLRNLLYNASRYAARRIRVTFRLPERDGYALTVEDDGPGIREEDRERVFGSFVQLDPPAGAKSGFGLGLAIVKRIMEWHGGTVSVQRSTLGGAKFTTAWRREKISTRLTGATA